MFFDYTMTIDIDDGTVKYGAVNRNKPLDRRVWRNIDGHRLPLGKMNRAHIQAAMQWCIRNKSSPANPTGWNSYTKDGYTYDEWIAMFLAKLLSPDTLD